MPAGVTYILGSKSGTLYTGVTSNFDKRITQHRAGIKSVFASKYACTRLLYYRKFIDIREAISHEKEIKGWTRAKKLALIKLENPDFRDLAEKLGWLMIGPAHSIAEEEEKLSQRIKLPIAPR